MIPIEVGRLAVAIGATTSGPVDARTQATGVVIDSRATRPGHLFVALAGEHADGHAFVAASIGAGAVAAVVDAGRPDLPAGLPLLHVPDPLRALGDLARAVAAAAPELTAVGITGSNGKTTTKEMLSGLLTAVGTTVATEGNLNNEIGVPTTVLRIERDTAFVVVEMGARRIGDIRYLADIVGPSVGVVLNVGTAHLGEFGSRAAIATAKGEMVERLPPDGVALLSADDALVAAMAARSSAPVRTFGRSPEADVRAERVSVDDLGRPSFDLVAGAGRARVQLRYVGEHHVGNALAAAAAALAVSDLDIAAVAALLSELEPVARWRMQVTERSDGVTIVNDAYNASPDSMAAALAALVRIGRGRRTVAVLGEMLELGGASTHEHEELGRLAVRSGIDVLVVVGAGAVAIQHGATDEGAVGIAGSGWDQSAAHASGDRTVVADVPDRAGAATLLGGVLRRGDVVLVKSSRDAGLRWLGDELATGATRDDPTTGGPGGRG